ncbi:MAG: uroporphyrinogen-III C-methyltransferase [Candidatus Omnitrophica bacterium]|nr:uroporphyrinogen-III C-methyltransferase [Candidatus Omnitrophota bacterium]
MREVRGRVYIVGAGPGDPELITIKGLKALKEADCVLYDFLSNSQLLDHAKDVCEKICVGKADGLHLREQDEINSLLYEKSREHKITVRLKGGDPFIFSRGHEEAVYLKSKGVAVDVIPGITSAIAGPEYYGIPLTIKNRISSVAIITGRKKDINAPIEAPGCGTLVYLMAVANISNVVKALWESGRSDETPCAFIERATRKDSRIVYATVGSVEEEAKRAGIKPPAVLVVGEVVDYGKRNV